MKITRVVPKHTVYVFDRDNNVVYSLTRETVNDAWACAEQFAKMFDNKLVTPQIPFACRNLPVKTDEVYWKEADEELQAWIDAG